MSSWAEIHTAARLLRVPPECLEGAVTRCVTVSSRVPGRREHGRTTRWLAECPCGPHPDMPCAHPLPPGDTLRPGLKIPAPGEGH